jgi:uncharacterized phage protein (TIGR01671 family)
MREIKFRAWCFDSKKLSYNIIGNIYISEMALWANSHEYELMQYIGLKDKNRKYIYEGDIVKIPAGWFGDIHYKESVGIIEYLENEFYPRNPNDNNGVTWQEFNWKDVEIIGNIYENPELLK